MSGGSEEQAPPEVRHYRHRGEVPWDIQGYESQIAEYLLTPQSY